MQSTNRRFSTLVVVILVALAAACSSTTSKTAPARTSTPVADTTVATTPSSTRPRGSLEFSELEYAGLSPFVFPAKERVCATKHFSSVKPAIPGTVLFDRKHQYCYFVVGPVLLTGADVESASVVYDPTESEWAVDLHWSNNDFLTKIAHPQVNKIVAIVLNGVVQSAPVINPGITGNEMSISPARTVERKRSTRPRRSWASHHRRCRSMRATEGVRRLSVENRNAQFALCANNALRRVSGV